MTLITRARIEGFLLDDRQREFESAIADLLSWYQQGLLQTREDVSEGIEFAPTRSPAAMPTAEQRQ
ncbi:hypothetical protein NKH54_24390 [Mesorhizobium sp. M1004]|uniref:hypothetical protein n=1 Tax=Mesorhizobium sp. M1004 TaxID=2957046 RepID=UPI00333DC3EC